MNFEEIIHNQSNEIQTLKSALITAEKRCEQYAQAYDQIQHQLKELQPIYNLLKDNVIEYDIASCDATTLQVLNEPGRVDGQIQTLA